MERFTYKDVMDRRTALQALLAATGTTALAACGIEQRAPTRTGERPMTAHTASTRMPSIFLAHGSPLLLDDTVWVDQLHRWAATLPRPRAVLMISAHWEDAPVTLGATRTIPLIYDFYGFPEQYYRTQYRAPGAPELAARVRGLLGGSPSSVASAPDRGLDHGAYVPLVAMYPEADVPVLQISIPTMEPAPLIELGRTLAPLRDEGVLIVGSGFLVHNLRSLSFTPGAPVASWATDFDAWAADAFARRDTEALIAYRTRAPGVRQSLPTHEHFVPSLIALGASLDTHETVQFPITGFVYGSMTKRSLQFG